ncbi:ATP-binding protein [Alloacidobacterium dinghuense]|uniref:ATP-binding protein n=1 Tax=Alloacidobacterium dinghuense TaxID=2763107 RepID=A0A7G8BHS0_9BACT|nr:ATP-binding protein [Alloacidobacterium dinghuense]QNI32090.1 ATP-binding protein [Alloacidobacterium dinghuense]
MIELVDARNFLRSIRETGYRSLAHSMAEFIDNSLQADATTVSITISAEQGGTILIADNGVGMSREGLRKALQFGGSTRFNDRHGTGRFGMGLPTSSVSLAKRVDVYTWKDKIVLHSFLDIDELEESALVSLPEPRRVARPPFIPKSTHGTAVILIRCDRSGKLNDAAGLAQTKFELRRIFRFPLQGILTLEVNGEHLKHFDPLFLSSAHMGVSAALYGPPLEYRIPVGNHSATVRVRFAELPISVWREMSNSEKQALGVSRGAGVSIVRNEREIAYGWYFFGSKRRENYDDWWRCELRFDPELDEQFGVNHTKQQISPTPEIDRLLTPDLENIARTLNFRVRQEFVRTAKPKTHQVPKVVSTGDRYLPSILTSKRSPVRNPNYLLQIDEETRSTAFFRVELAGSRIAVWLNPNHPITSAYLAAKSEDEGQVELFEYALLFAARVELGACNQKQLWWFRHFRTEWSDALAAFLGN